MLVEGWMGAGGARVGLLADGLGGEFDFRCCRVLYEAGAEADGVALMGIRGLAEEP